MLNAILMMVRNLLVARLISLQDYGLASTFVLAVTIVEMMSALGLQQQMVQSKQGDEPYLQASLQGFQAFRGVINGTSPNNTSKSFSPLQHGEADMTA